MLKWTFMRATIRCKYTPTLTSSWRPRRLPSFKSFSRLQGHILERERRQCEAQTYQHALDHQMCPEEKQCWQQEEHRHQDEECETCRREEACHVDEANEALHNLNYNLKGETKGQEKSDKKKKLELRDAMSWGVWLMHLAKHITDEQDYNLHP